MRRHLLGAGADGHFTRDDFHDFEASLKKIRATGRRRVAIPDGVVVDADPATFLAYNEVRLKPRKFAARRRRLAPTRCAPLVLLRR